MNKFNKKLLKIDKNINKKFLIKINFPKKFD